MVINDIAPVGGVKRVFEKGLVKGTTEDVFYDVKNGKPTEKIKEDDQETNSDYENGMTYFNYEEIQSDNEEIERKYKEYYEGFPIVTPIYLDFMKETLIKEGLITKDDLKDLKTKNITIMLLRYENSQNINEEQDEDMFEKFDNYRGDLGSEERDELNNEHEWFVKAYNDGYLMNFEEE